jgi:hypothetical protein
VQPEVGAFDRKKYCKQLTYIDCLEAFCDVELLTCLSTV